MSAEFKLDWRQSASYYPSEKPCVVCGSTYMIGSEPRFNYSVCQDHSLLSPVQINDYLPGGSKHQLKKEQKP